MGVNRIYKRGRLYDQIESRFHESKNYELTNLLFSSSIFLISTLKLGSVFSALYFTIPNLHQLFHGKSGAGSPNFKILKIQNFAARRLSDFLRAVLTSPKISKPY